MIIALVMAGGKGLRLKSDIEKPLYPLKDKPLMSYVLDNINESKLIEKTVVAVSPNAPNTKDFVYYNSNHIYGFNVNVNTAFFQILMTHFMKVKKIIFIWIL